MNMRVESFPDRFDCGDAERFKHVVELFADQFDAVQKMAKFFRLNSWVPGGRFGLSVISWDKLFFDIH